jgi:hypothetical protein
MTLAFAGTLEETKMSKLRQSNKESKKQPAMTPKEKKSAKHAKKHAGDVVSIIPR